MSAETAEKPTEVVNSLAEPPRSVLARARCLESQRFQLHQASRWDELSMHQERNPTAVSQLVAKIRDLHNKVNSLSDARDLRS